MTDLYDVVAVKIVAGTVRLMDRAMTKANAESYVTMAVYRRGVDDEFFCAVRAGAYTDGEKYDGMRVSS